MPSDRSTVARGGSIRLNPEGRIIENWKAEFYEPLGRTVRPNLTVRPKIFVFNVVAIGLPRRHG